MSAEFDINTAAAAGIRRPSTFLSLAPVRSESYPTAPITSPTISATLNVEPVESDVQLHVCDKCGSKIAPPSPEVKPRRSSSISSTLSAGQKQRFLKLGPVHWGGIPGEDDYAIED